ncbi:hypothetical protein [Bacillus thuringiensis]|uniref:hypothetical protein n=1 Tax=Bacillus thuringiensis TaxID=1428 RepID=UPI000BF29B99|nr:hypothetical protein [Bacillus thuringiensis]PEY74454.1 hypothetical protein CN355_07520 [Bacillus thuringiensis]
MKILHFCPKAKGIRFFNKIKQQLNEDFIDQPDTLMNYWNVGEFLKTLRGRTSELDAVIISAHGWEDSILKPFQGSFEKTITLEEAPLFKNKFVFANSCYAAQKFGPALVDNGAFSFVGFNDSIGDVFLSSMEYKDSIEKIFKKIYTKSLAEAFTLFVKQCLTTREFCERIDFGFRKNLSNVSKMNLSEINTAFQVSINEDNKSIMKLMKLEFIEKFNELKRKITLLGEENYIYWSSIKNLSNEQLIDRLNKIENISEENNLYKSFVKMLIYVSLGDQEKYLAEFERFYLELEMINEKTNLFEPPVTIQKEFEEIKKAYVG